MVGSNRSLVLMMSLSEEQIQALLGNKPGPKPRNPESFREDKPKEYKGRAMTPEFIQELLAKDEAKKTRAMNIDPWAYGFDPAAIFLLDINFLNLFEQSPHSEWWFKCKGCKAMSKRPEREAHWLQHRKDFGIVNGS
jgi:hypothetical protein